MSWRVPVATSMTKSSARWPGRKVRGIILLLFATCWLGGPEWFRPKQRLNICDYFWPAMKAIQASVFPLDGAGVGIPDSNLAYGTRHPKARRRVRSRARRAVRGPGRDPQLYRRLRYGVCRDLIANRERSITTVDTELPTRTVICLPGTPSADNRTIRARSTARAGAAFTRARPASRPAPCDQDPRPSTTAPDSTRN